MNPQVVPLTPGNVFHGLEMLNSSNQRFGIFEASTSFFSSVQNNDFCAECLNSFLPLKEFDPISEDKYCNSHKLKAEVSCNDISFRLDTQYNHSSELDKASLPLKNETGKPKSIIPTPGLTLKPYVCGSKRSMSDKGIFCNLGKNLRTATPSLLMESEKDFNESKSTLTKFCKSGLKCDVDNFPNDMALQQQTGKSSDEYGLAETFVQSVQSIKYENSMTRTCNAENNVLPEIFDKLKKIPNNEDSFADSFLDSYSIEGEKYLQELEELEFSVHNIHIIDDDKVKNYLFRDVSSTKKTNNPDQKSSQCDLQDDCLLDFLCSEFDFLHERKDNTNSFNKEQIVSISASRVKTEYEDSNPNSEQIVSFLLSCLDHVDKDLMLKENEAIKLKLYFETNAKELVSICKLNITEDNISNELQVLMNNCDKLLEDIKKDRVECNWYSENIQNVLNFLQKNCLKEKL